MKLHYAGQPGQGFGWGVCNTNLRHQLSFLTELSDDADVVFMPLADHDLNPATPARGKVNLGYCFFEYELGQKAAENAAKYDVVFAGSTWCVDRLKERGITNVELLIQGVNERDFPAQPKRSPDGSWRIFSGGKFEYRKGQDLVIAAFREFSRTHSDAHLVCSWFNPWPSLVSQFARISAAATMGTPEMYLSQVDYFEGLMWLNVIDIDRVTILPPLRIAEMALGMQHTDCGLFPNRCEGGTNLVMMEYLSTGRPVVANARTGHADIASAITYPYPCELDAMKWANQDVDAIVAALETAYSKRNEPFKSFAGKWTWEEAADKIVATASRLLYADGNERND